MFVHVHMCPCINQIWLLISVLHRLHHWSVFRSYTYSICFHFVLTVACTLNKMSFLLSVLHLTWSLINFDCTYRSNRSDHYRRFSVLILHTVLLHVVWKRQVSYSLCSSRTRSPDTTSWTGSSGFGSWSASLIIHSLLKSLCA